MGTSSEAPPIPTQARADSWKDSTRQPTQERAMSLMQEILDKIEAEAAEETRKALAAHKTIDEAEALRARLVAAGWEDPNVGVSSNANKVNFFAHTRHSDSLSIINALDTCGIEWQPGHQDTHYGWTDLTLTEHPNIRVCILTSALNPLQQSA